MTVVPAKIPKQTVCDTMVVVCPYVSKGNRLYHIYWLYYQANKPMRFGQ